jgi:hypothetical protein
MDPFSLWLELFRFTVGWGINIMLWFNDGVVT